MGKYSPAPGQTGIVNALCENPVDIFSVWYNRGTSKRHMISLLKGAVVFRHDPYIILDVHDVGYKVYATATVLASARLQEVITVYTYTHVREDLLELYGFSSINDLQLFEQLISVSGIGPKTAIGVFALGSSSKITSAILEGNVAFFTAVPRLGKKNAQKVIIELKNKVGGDFEIDLSTIDGKTDGEVLSALKTFGFTTREVQEAIHSLGGKGETAEEKIRLALKHLGKL